MSAARRARRLERMLNRLATDLRIAYWLGENRRRGGRLLLLGSPAGLTGHPPRGIWFDKVMLGEVDIDPAGSVPGDNAAP
jgi:hypothetical protein